jgi:hypothetical protein
MCSQNGNNFAPFIAGILSGVAGLFVFLVIHHFWITPIWFILPLGLVIAGLGGLVVGWSYREIRAGLPPRPWTALALAALIGAILAPGILLAQLREPLINLSLGAIPRVAIGRLLIHFSLELLIPATVIGAVAGWFLGRTRRAALATGLAGLVFALGPGHNIPFLGNTPAVGKGLTLLLAITVTSAFVLVEASEWLKKKKILSLHVGGNPVK